MAVSWTCMIGAGVGGDITQEIRRRGRRSKRCLSICERRIKEPTVDQDDLRNFKYGKLFKSSFLFIRGISVPNRAMYAKQGWRWCRHRWFPWTRMASWSESVKRWCCWTHPSMRRGAVLCRLPLRGWPEGSNESSERWEDRQPGPYINIHFKGAVLSWLTSCWTVSLLSTKSVNHWKNELTWVTEEDPPKDVDKSSRVCTAFWESEAVKFGFVMTKLPEEGWWYRTTVSEKKRYACLERSAPSDILPTLVWPMQSHYQWTLKAPAASYRCWPAS